jgi:hypothetical protein
MGKTKNKSVAVGVLQPYVKRAMDDPEFREDLLAAFSQLGSRQSGRAESRRRRQSPTRFPGGLEPRRRADDCDDRIE